MQLLQGQLYEECANLYDRSKRKYQRPSKVQSSYSTFVLIRNRDFRVCRKTLQLLDAHGITHNGDVYYRCSGLGEKLG